MTSKWKPNVTVAAVIERDNQFLMIEELTSDGIRLNQPAGHLEPSETLQAGCVREALEESAWQVEVQSLLGMYMSRYFSERTQEEVTYLRFAFICKALVDTRQSLDEGIIRALWMSPDEIRSCIVKHRSPLVMQCIDDYLRLKQAGHPGYPLDMLFHHETALGGVLDSTTGNTLNPSSKPI